MGNNQKFFITGSDSYRALEFIRSLSSDFDIIDTSDQIDTALLNAAQQNLFTENKLTVFRNLLPQLKDKLRVLQTPTLKIVIWQEQKQASLPREIESLFTAKNFPALKPYEVTKWVEQQLVQRQMELDYRVVKKLVELHGSNLFLLANELDKIYLYTKNWSNQSLTVQDLALISQTTVDESVFSLLDALGQKKITKIKQSLRKLFDCRIDEWYLFHLLIKHTRQLYCTKVGLKIKAHPFVVKKITQQAQKWPKDGLFIKLTQLLDIELQVKKGAAVLKPELVNWMLREN